jgi:hypothetical protein
MLGPRIRSKQTTDCALLASTSYTREPTCTWNCAKHALAQLYSPVQAGKMALPRLFMSFVHIETD